MSITVALIAGLFSLLGAFAGAFLARRTQYEKWLRENRSEVFSKFLLLMHDAGIAAVDEAAKKSPDLLKIDDIYRDALNYVNVVRLYMPKNDRTKLQQLAREIKALHSNTELGDSRMSVMEGKYGIM